MSRHDDRISLFQMRDHAAEAVELAIGRSRQDLDKDRLLNLALVRLIEIVGEAATRVSPTGRQTCPTIPWADIIGMRNRIIHAYDKIDFDILWAVIRDDLPPLIRMLDAVLSD